MRRCAGRLPQGCGHEGRRAGAASARHKLRSIYTRSARPCAHGGLQDPGTARAPPPLLSRSCRAGCAHVGLGRASPRRDVPRRGVAGPRQPRLDPWEREGGEAGGEAAVRLLARRGRHGRAARGGCEDPDFRRRRKGPPRGVARLRPELLHACERRVEQRCVVHLAGEGNHLAQRHVLPPPQHRSSLGIREDHLAPRAGGRLRRPRRAKGIFGPCPPRRRRPGGAGGGRSRAAQTAQRRPAPQVGRRSTRPRGDPRPHRCRCHPRGRRHRCWQRTPRSCKVTRARQPRPLAAARASAAAAGATAQ